MSRKTKTGAAGGRCGTQTRTRITKDKMGFDYEVLDTINRHGSKSIRQIYRDKAKNKHLDDELSGKEATDARKKVTLPYLKWMDRPEEED